MIESQTLWSLSASHTRSSYTASVWALSESCEDPAGVQSADNRAAHL